MEQIVINAIIGVVAVFGFFWYWGKNSGVFKEGGVVYEWWKKIRENKKDKNS